MKRYFLIIFLLILCLSGCWPQDLVRDTGVAQGPAAVRTATETASEPVEEKLARAYRDRQSGFMVEFSAAVIKMLPDDNDGSRHQRFLVRLSTGQTLLVSHNIDLAPRVDGLGPGDTVDVYGQYEWNEKGGVIHWTHHDPQGRHDEGWIEYNGRRYQ